MCRAVCVLEVVLGVPLVGATPTQNESTLVSADEVRLI